MDSHAEQWRVDSTRAPFAAYIPVGFRPKRLEESR